MTQRALLAATRTYIEAQIERAKKPYQDPYTLLSFASSLEKAIDAKPGQSDLVEQTRRLVWKTVLSYEMGTYDVFTPEEAKTLIGLTLASVHEQLAL